MNGKNNKQSVIGRRKFLKAGGVLAGAALTSGFGVVANAKEHSAGSIEWDREVDVICVGSGAAACSAAVTAASRGASVVVLEKMPMPGGTTGKSGGIIWIPNHKYMKLAGVDDNKVDCLKYMARYAYPELYDASDAQLGLPTAEYRLLEQFYDQGSVMVDFMEETEAVKFESYRMWGVDQVPPDYAAHLPENKASYGRALQPVSGSGPTSGGGSLAYQLETWLSENGVPILLEHRVVNIVNDGSRVVGVEVDKAGEKLFLKAKQGVIFGTGGFVHNEALVRENLPPVYGSCAMVGSTGDLIPIAQRAGVKMGRTNTAWRTPVILEQALRNRAVPHGVYFAPGDSMIHVNKYGRRVVNEKRNYNDRTRAHYEFDPVNIEYPNLFMFMVFDERTLQRYAGALPIPSDKREAYWLIEGEGITGLTRNLENRLRELSSELGAFELSEEFSSNLKSTIERFNQFAETGQDQDFDRGKHDYDRVWQKVFSPAKGNSDYPENDKPNQTMYPIDAQKLYAVILAPGALDTSGGPQINEHGQMLDPDGNPIQGLYGAGNCIASPTGPAYLGGGGTIGLAMTFGYLAALHATGVSA